jgi:acyl-CoA thioesterase
MQHALDAAIALTPTGEDTFQGRTHPEYQNFIGPFGGITAAQALNAVLLHPKRNGEPVAFTVNFAAALADGEFTARVRLARNNRSTQHWIVELVQQGETMLTATALTAQRRDTWGFDELQMPDVPAPHTVQMEPGRAVAWLAHYERRVIEGDVPQRWEGQDSGSTCTRLWLRDRPDRPLDFPALTAMADNFFPRLWLRRATQVPLGTVTMTVYYHAREPQLRDTGTGYLLGQVRGQGFGAGYFDHSAQLWNEAGTLLATTHQAVYYKE